MWQWSACVHLLVLGLEHQKRLCISRYWVRLQVPNYVTVHKETHAAVAGRDDRPLIGNGVWEIQWRWKSSVTEMLRVKCRNGDFWKNLEEASGRVILTLRKKEHKFETGFFIVSYSVFSIISLKCSSDLKLL